MSYAELSLIPTRVRDHVEKGKYRSTDNTKTGKERGNSYPKN